MTLEMRSFNQAVEYRRTHLSAGKWWYKVCIAGMLQRKLELGAGFKHFVVHPQKENLGKMGRFFTMGGA